MAEMAPYLQKRLLLKSGHSLVLIDPETLILIEKQGKKCLIHTACGCYSISESLSALERKLPFPPFFRCHKSFIINTDKVERIRPYADRAYEVTFHGYNAKACMRRHKFEEFCGFFLSGAADDEGRRDTDS